MSFGFKFEYKKATQALNYFALKEGGNINKMKALKLIYLADRYHLRKYGRLITNDEYFAMDWGPVASGTKDIAEMKEIFLSDNERLYANAFIKIVGSYNLKSIRTVDKSVFSKSDIEAFNFAWSKFGDLEEFDLADLTHKYPEWKKHEQDLKTCSRLRMSPVDFFEDPNENIEKCYSLSVDEKNERIVHLKEIAFIDSLWG